MKRVFRVRIDVEVKGGCSFKFVKSVGEAMSLIGVSFVGSKVMFVGKVMFAKGVFPSWKLEPFQKKNKMRVRRKRLNRFEAYCFQVEFELQ